MAAAMSSLLINIDVSDLAEATRFYTEAFGLKVGRRLGEDIVELLGFPSPLYLLEKKEGSLPFEGASGGRSFRRHWTPVHFDLVVGAIEPAMAKAKAAGARQEGEMSTASWGKLALFSDPFGNGFCLVQFLGRGYDELVQA